MDIHRNDARASVGEGVAARLFAAEAAIDSALKEAAGLLALLPEARAQAYLSAVSGQRAFTGAAGAVSALTEARARLVDTHGVLAALARKMGLDTLAVGPLDKPDDEPPIGGGPKPPAFDGANLNKTLTQGRNAC